MKTIHAQPEPATPVESPSAVRQIADLPGPRPWPLVGNALQVNLAQLHLDLERWVAQYGRIYRVRLGQSMNIVVIADHQLMTQLLKDRPDGFRRPSRLSEVLAEIGIKHGVFLAEGQTWANQRRMVMASFSPGHVRAYFPTLVRVTETLKRRWQSSQIQEQQVNQGESVQSLDMQAELMRYTVDVISGLAFGQETNTLERDDDIIQHHLDKIFPAIWRRTNAVLPYWRYVSLKADRQLTASVKVVNQAIVDFIAQARERLQEPARRAAPQNLLEAMIVAADAPDSGVNDDDVAGNVFTMLLAGEDTTATSISWLLYLLSRNPLALQKAITEVDRVLGPADDASTWTPEKLAALDYLEACAHESMRMKPVAPFNVVEPLKDTVVGDVLVPRGTAVLMLQRKDSLDARYFPEPMDFQPERWLAEDAANTLTQAKRVSMPFGAGPRICPGRYLALMEIKMAVAMLLQNFKLVDVATPDGGEARELMSFTMVPDGLSLKLAPRI